MEPTTAAIPATHFTPTPTSAEIISAQEKDIELLKNLCYNLGQEMLKLREENSELRKELDSSYYITEKIKNLTYSIKNSAGSLSLIQYTSMCLLVLLPVLYFKE